MDACELAAGLEQSRYHFRLSHQQGTETRHRLAGDHECSFVNSSLVDLVWAVLHSVMQTLLRACDGDPSGILSQSDKSQASEFLIG